LAVYHWSVGNPQYGIKWMRRDGKIITRNAIAKQAIVHDTWAGFPDLYLYELDKELTDDDAENIAIYNKWPRFDTYTGTKCIDPQAVVLSGITSGITSGTYEVQRQIGRRIWALDGQDRAISYRSCPGITFTWGGQIEEAGMGFVLSAPHSYEPLNCAYNIHVGDSGTHWFITGKGHTAHAKYDYSLGITLQPTMYLGPYDQHNADYDPGRSALFLNLGSTAYGGILGEDVSPIDMINRYLIAADQKIIEQIDIDVSGGNPPPYIIPVSGVCYSSNEVVTSSPNVNGPLISTFNKSQFLTSNQFDAAYYGMDIIGQGIITSVDGNVLTLNGITGSFIITDSSFDYRINGGTAGALYNKINPFTTPVNNGLGTTAGIRNILNNEAAGYTFDNNDPFEIFNG
jgi:hypothetical protein